MSPEEWLAKGYPYHGSLQSLSKNVEVYDIALMNFSSAVTNKGVKHHFFKVGKWRGSSFFVNEYVRRIDPHVVVVHGLLFPLRLLILRKLLPSHIKIVVQHHAERPYRGVRSFLQRYADKSVDKYFFATKNMADEWLSAKLISSAGKILELPEASSIFSETNLHHKNANEFIWVGRLNDNKDPLTVAAAFASYIKNKPAAKLYMIYQEDTLLKELQELIQTNNASDNIILAGKIPHPQMQQWYERATFIISSSYYEGCNISVMEGMSCGCIPVVTDIPSFALHTANGTIGLQFEPGNKQALLNCLLKTNEINILSEQQKVQHYFREHLSFDAIAKKMNEYFHQLERS